MEINVKAAGVFMKRTSGVLLILLMIVLLGNSSFNSQGIPFNLIEVVSISSWKDTEYNTSATPYYRFRAASYSAGNEGMPWVEIDKIHIEQYPLTVYWKKRLDVTSHPETKKEFEKLRGEQSYGCCPLSNLQWDGLILKYEIGFVKKLFQCKLPNLHHNKFDVICTAIDR